MKILNCSEEYSELKEESRCAVFVDGLSSIGMKREILNAAEHSFDHSVKLARHVEMRETRVRDNEVENVYRIRPFQQVRSNQQCGNDWMISRGGNAIQYILFIAIDRKVLH